MSSSTSTGPRSGILILIDTHIALWLYAGMAERVPAATRALIADGQPRISPLVTLELAYLKEVGRARDPVATMLAELRRDVGVEIADVSLAELTQAAIDLSWTRDPFDRLIAAHAIVENAPLVTADQTIREHLSLATWE